MTNRIDQLTVSLPSDRQTANNNFGAMLARGVSNSASFAGAATAMIPGGAVLSAAINRTAAAATRETSARGAVGGHGSGSHGTGAQTSGATGGDELSSQRDLMQANQQWSEQYLSLQMAMQQESREFTAVSNILKVRHESAKTAINNIR